MGRGKSVPTRNMAASASAVVDSDDLIAKKLHAVEQLTAVYGFSFELAHEAVDAVVLSSLSVEEKSSGTSTGRTSHTDTAIDIDITACYNYILDSNLASDQGGPVVPIDTCDHVEHHVLITIRQLPRRPETSVCSFVATETAAVNKQKAHAMLKSECGEDGVSCAATENWLCLECGVVRCSRYCNGHALQHWHETQIEGADNCGTDGHKAAAPAGHCVMLSLSDLSVWCHICSAYLSTSTGSTAACLQPLVQELERLKFSESHHVDPHPKQQQQQEQQPSGVFQEPERKKYKSVDGEERKVKHAVENTDLETDDCDEQSDGSDHDDNDESDDDMKNVLRQLSIIAEARGIPLEWLITQACREGGEESDDEVLEYPFGELPASLDDVADFILSDKCQSIIILAGAGMSVASGIPDFRSADGLYATLDADLLTADEAERQAIRMDPTVSLQQDMFLQNPLPCLELQREFILGTRAHRWKATIAHRFVELLHEKTGKLVRHYTQNIDGLEDQCTKLPREKVIAVHGSMDRAECAQCSSEADYDEFCDSVQRQIKDLSGKDLAAPKKSTPIACKVCGYNAMKPAIVLFKSSLPKAFFENVPSDIQGVDLFIVIGTSLRVAPACSLVPQVPKTAMRLLVNREPSGGHLGMIFDPSKSKRDFFAQGECDEVLLNLMDRLGWLDDLKPLLTKDSLPSSSAKLLEAHLAQRASKSHISHPANRLK